MSTAGCCEPGVTTQAADPARPLALIGNPNSGKTTLFNVLTGLRAQTGNYPGTTVEHRSGRVLVETGALELIDLPGVYDLQATTDDERVAVAVLDGHAAGTKPLGGVIVVVDAAHLNRSLFLVSQVLQRGLPTVVALNMVDAAAAQGIQIDADRLAVELGCPVVPLVARTGEGVATLRAALHHLPGAPRVSDAISACGTCGGCRFQSRYAWSDAVAARCSRETPAPPSVWTERVDRVLTHPVVGVAAFAAVMLGVFILIFQIASVPMDLIDSLFSGLGGWLTTWLPAGDLRDLLVQGIIGGVGGVLVFLPQICILFFCLALLEDSGYLARAAFVMDRLMGRVGLPGKAFVPLLSAHACAIPAIMATRVIPDRRDRLVTILVAPLMSCSARIPVYSMLAALLFANEPLKAALVFTGAYVLGLVMALTMAFVFKKTLLPGEATPLVLELPSYRRPRLRTAFLTVLDRATVFVKNAGTVILFISVLLWAMATYPRSAPPPEAVALQAQAATLEGPAAAAAQAEAERLTSRHALAHSAAGRLGHWIEPALRPLGFDWQIGIGVLTSFAAREVVVSTLAVVYGVGAEAADEAPDSLYDALRRATRSDGSRVFTPATCFSLLVFYVLAMQCLPTQAVTRRETNSWKWPAIQFGYMSVLAWVVSFLVYQGLKLAGVA